MSADSREYALEVLRDLYAEHGRAQAKCGACRDRFAESGDGDASCNRHWAGYLKLRDVSQAFGLAPTDLECLDRTLDESRAVALVARWPGSLGRAV